MATHASELTIARLAHASGVRRGTIRFYEQRGLLSPPPRSAAGYRLYAPDEVRRVRFIKSAQALGFSLDDIAQLLVLRGSTDGTCAAVKARAEAKIADIERRIAALAAMKTALAGIASACEGGAETTDACPILAALEDAEAER
jgi:MerR family copper efflux transcriptional regulator